MKNRFIKANKKDIVATALVDIEKGENANIYTNKNVYLESVQAKERIPYGNKIALKDIAVGEKIIKYGEIIGECIKKINAGELVHVHNVKSNVAQIPPELKKEIMRKVRNEERVDG